MDRGRARRGDGAMDVSDEDVEFINGEKKKEFINGG